MTRSLHRPSELPETLRILLLLGAVLLIGRLGSRIIWVLALGVPLEQLPIPLAGLALLWTVVALLLLPGFLLAEAVSVHRGRRAVPYIASVLLVSAIAVGLVVPIREWIGLRPDDPAVWLTADRLARIHLDVVMLLGLAAAIYSGHRHQLDAVRAFHGLELRRTELLGRLAASRLETARARVRPEAFITELRALRSTYLVDPVAGGAGLDALIVRLRAASRSASV